MNRYPNDPHAWAETDDFMLGRDLLVANVVEQGATSRRVRLPVNTTGWWDFFSGQWHAPGEIIDKSVDLATIPLFVRAGAVLPLSVGAERADPAADRVLALFPVLGDGTSFGDLFEDDGASVDAPYSLLKMALTSRGDTLALDWQQAGTTTPVLGKAIVSMPQGENRSLTVRGTHRGIRTEHSIRMGQAAVQQTAMPVEALARSH